MDIPDEAYENIAYNMAALARRHGGAIPDWRPYVPVVISDAEMEEVIEEAARGWFAEHGWNNVKQDV